PACRRCWASRPPECHCGTPALSPAAIASLVPQQESAADRVERVVVLASAAAGEGEREFGAVLAPPLRHEGGEEHVVVPRQAAAGAIGAEEVVLGPVGHRRPWAPRSRGIINSEHPGMA